MKVCPECDGDGEVIVERDWEAGAEYDVTADCPDCDGTGEVEHDPDDPYDVPGGLYPISVIDTWPR